MHDQKIALVVPRQPSCPRLARPNNRCHSPAMLAQRLPQRRRVFVIRGQLGLIQCSMSQLILHVRRSDLLRWSRHVRARSPERFNSRIFTQRKISPTAQQSTKPVQNDDGRPSPHIHHAPAPGNITRRGPFLPLHKNPLVASPQVHVHVQVHKHGSLPLVSQNPRPMYPSTFLASTQ